MFALPLAMVVLMIILGAARLLIIPLINIIVSILGAFLIVWRVALSMTVNSTACVWPNFSLFLLLMKRNSPCRPYPHPTPHMPTHPSSRDSP